MRPYQNDLRDRVVAAMESGMSCREAEAPTGTSCIFTDMGSQAALEHA
jgi:transposase